MDRVTKGVLVPGMLMVMAIGLLVASCAPKAPAGPAPAAGPITLRYSSHDPPGQPKSIQMKFFSEEVAKRTAGKVKIENYYSSELYKSGEALDALQTGALEMSVTSPGNLSAQNPLFGFYNYFFLLASTGHLARSKDRLNNILLPFAEKLDVKVIHWFYNGDMAIISTKPIAKPEDLKGKMIRGMNPETLAALKALGAVPASIDPAEVYDALGKGSIDGAISGWITFTGRKWTEVAKHYVGPVVGGIFLSLMSMRTWNKLPKDVQTTLLEVGQETEKVSLKDSDRYDLEAIEAIKKIGTVTLLNSPEQLAAWQKFSRPTWDAWLEKNEKAGYGSQAREMMKILDETR